MAHFLQRAQLKMLSDPGALAVSSQMENFRSAGGLTKGLQANLVGKVLTIFTTGVGQNT
jgi:hypothetical protein